ncbi:MAG: nicotinate phosphoribosyltransferase [Bacilli bacterium]|nr:nicotinate phosphoribosyltransferase [Bacilli bacterium]
MKNKTMMTDFYELTMAQTYYDKGEQNKKVYFDIFFRKNPFEGGYAIMGGLDNIVDYINNFKISDEDINYLRSTGKFKEEFLEYLKNLKFTGDIFAIEDGTPIFPNEPVLTVRANVIEAQLIETALLANFNHGTLVTTAAKRITNAAGDIPVMEFGARRARGVDSAVEASKYAYVGGCCGTSNVLAGMKNDIPVLGTMAHSMICDADSEYEAFLDYAKSNPDNCVFLVDTFDTLRSGVPNAIKVAQDYLVPNGYKLKGIRIDSGDLAYLSKESRRLLDEAGFRDATICLSNGLDENTIKSLLDQGACIDSIGAGDNIAASKERVGGVYKLVAIEKDGKLIPKIKVSEDSIKTINPGYKKVYRFYDKKTGYALGDVIALAEEKIPKDKYTLICPTEEWKTTTIENYEVKELQVPIFENGKQVYEVPTVKMRKEYCANEFKTIYPEIKRSANPHGYYVDLTKKLLELKKQLILESRKQPEQAKQYKKVK